MAEEETRPQLAEDEAGTKAGTSSASREPKATDQPAKPAAGVPGSAEGRPSSADEAAPDAADSEAVEQDLAALLEDVTRERDEYLDLARRAKADFENYRKRAAQQATDASKRGKAELARELLPAIDSLERALEATRSESEASRAAVEAPAVAGDDSEGLAKGVLLVRDQLLATLERAGVEGYDPAGERFDPTWHEALSTRAEDGVDAGVVLETLDRGYRLDGQVLRPARVVVSE